MKVQSLLKRPAARIGAVTLALLAVNMYLLRPSAGHHAPQGTPRPPTAPAAPVAPVEASRSEDARGPEGDPTPGNPDLPPEGQPRAKSAMERVSDAAKWGEDTVLRPAINGAADVYTNLSAADAEEKLCLLAGRGEIAQVQAGLRRGLSVNARDKEQKTPLIHAATNGKLAMVLFLMRQAAIDPDARDNDGCTAITYAEANATNGGMAALYRPIVEAIALNTRTRPTPPPSDADLYAPRPDP